MKLTKSAESKDKLTLSFTSEKVSVAYMNTLRRSIVDFVPTLAIEDVEIRQNSSVLYDEVFAHRLGLLPIITEPGMFSFRVEGEGSMGSELKLQLQAKGPCTVLAEQMQSKDPKSKPAQPKMPIVRLLKDQEVEVEATAILGRGIEHTKWSPGIVYYEYASDVTVNNKVDDLDQKLHHFPPQVIENGKVSKDKIVKLNLVEACESVAPDVVQVTYNPEVLHVTVESWGQMPAQTMIQQGAQYVDQALDALMQAAKTLK